MTFTELCALIGAGGSVIAATWILRSGLSKLEGAFREHKGHTESELRGLDTRVIRLEDWRTGKK